MATRRIPLQWWKWILLIAGIPVVLGVINLALSVSYQQNWGFQNTPVTTGGIYLPWAANVVLFSLAFVALGLLFSLAIYERLFWMLGASSYMIIVLYCFQGLWPVSPTTVYRIFFWLLASGMVVIFSVGVEIRKRLPFVYIPVAFLFVFMMYLFSASQQLAITLTVSTSPDLVLPGTLTTGHVQPTSSSSSTIGSSSTPFASLTSQQIQNAQESFLLNNQGVASTILHFRQMFQSPSLNMTDMVGGILLSRNYSQTPMPKGTCEPYRQPMPGHLPFLSLTLFTRVVLDSNLPNNVTESYEVYNINGKMGVQITTCNYSDRVLNRTTDQQIVSYMTFVIPTLAKLGNFRRMDSLFPPDWPPPACCFWGAAACAGLSEYDICMCC